MTPEDP